MQENTSPFFRDIFIRLDSLEREISQLKTTINESAQIVSTSNLLRNSDFSHSDASYFNASYPNANSTLAIWRANYPSPLTSPPPPNPSANSIVETPIGDIKFDWNRQYNYVRISSSSYLYQTINQAYFRPAGELFLSGELCFIPNLLQFSVPVAPSGILVFTAPHSLIPDNKIYITSSPDPLLSSQEFYVDSILSPLSLTLKREDGSPVIFNSTGSGELETRIIFPFTLNFSILDDTWTPLEQFASAPFLSRIGGGTVERKYFLEYYNDKGKRLGCSSLSPVISGRNSILSVSPSPINYTNYVVINLRPDQPKGWVRIYRLCTGFPTVLLGNYPVPRTIQIEDYGGGTPITPPPITPVKASDSIEINISRIIPLTNYRFLSILNLPPAVIPPSTPTLQIYADPVEAIPAKTLGLTRLSLSSALGRWTAHPSDMTVQNPPLPPSQVPPVSTGGSGDPNLPPGGSTCMEESVKILTLEKKLVKIKDLKKGDTILSFDNYWKIVPTYVENIKIYQSQDKAYKINSTTILSPSHQLYVKQEYDDEDSLKPVIDIYKASKKEILCYDPETNQFEIKLVTINRFTPQSPLTLIELVLFPYKRMLIIGDNSQPMLYVSHNNKPIIVE